MAITPDSFDIDKVVFGEISIDGRGNYNIPLYYEKGGKQNNIYLDLPLGKTDSRGIWTQSNDGGGEGHSLRYFFPLQKPEFIKDYDEEGNETGGHYEDIGEDYEEAQGYADIIEQIYEKTCTFLLKNRTKVGLNDYDSLELIKKLGLKNPIYRKPLEEDPAKKDPSIPPSIFLKFIESGPNAQKNPNHIYTKFFGRDRKEIDWTDLRDNMMYLMPTAKIERVYIAKGQGAKNIQCKVSNAIIFSVKPQDNMAAKLEKIKEHEAANPGSINGFLRDIERLRIKAPGKKVEEEKGKEEEKEDPVKDFMKKQKPRRIRLDTTT